MDSVKDYLNTGKEGLTKSYQYLSDSDNDWAKRYNDHKHGIGYIIFRTLIIITVISLIIALGYQVWKTDNDKFVDTSKKIDDTIAGLSNVYLKTNDLDNKIKAYNFATKDGIDQIVDKEIDQRLPILTSIEKAIKDMNTTSINETRTDQIHTMIDTELSNKLVDAKKQLDDAFNAKLQLILAINNAAQTINNTNPSTK